MAAFLGIRYKGILGSGFALGQGGIILPSAPSYDPDAQVYFTAVEDAGGELTLLEKDLVNTWFVTERAAGRLSKYKAVYPFKGKTSGAAAINMVNPSTYDLTFTNFVAADFAVSGVLTGDGSTKYADVGSTFSSMFTSIDDLQMGFRTSTDTPNAFVVLMGAYNPGTNDIIAIQTNAANGNVRIYAGRVTDGVDEQEINSPGLAVGTRTSSTSLKQFVSGVSDSENTTPVTGSLLPYNPYIFARNNSGTAGNHTSIGSQLTFLAEGLSNSDMLTINSNIEDMLVDPDAQAYIQEVFDQGGSLTLAQQAAVNNLVKSMKADGLWDGALRILPMMGGEVDSASVDLVTRTKMTNQNFVDADADAKIGLTSDGSTKLLKDPLDMDVLGSSGTDIQIGAFTIDSEPSVNGQYFMGSRLSSTWCGLRYASTTGCTIYSTGVTEFASGGEALSASGIESIIGARYSSTSLKAYTNGVAGTENTTSSTNPLPADEMDYFSFGVNFSDFTSGGFFIAETWSESDVLRFEKLYKAFIQQVQDEETYDTDAAAYFIAVEDAGGTLTDNVKDEFDAFVVREKAGGRWGKLKRLYPYLGGVINSAIIDAVTNNAATNNNFVDGDVDAVCGLTGDAATKYLDIGTTASSFFTSANDTQAIHFQFGARGLTQSLISAFDSGTSTFFGLLETGADTRYVSGNASIDVNGILPSPSQINAITGGRFSSTDLRIYMNGANLVQNTAANSSSLPNFNIFIFAQNNAGSARFFANNKGFGSIMAEGMSPDELLACESSYRTFINNIQAYAALMDSYSGAAAAYSLRKVYSTYEGSAINVRRSSDNATQDIGFDGYILDEAALLSFVGAGNGYVTTWYDQSGNGADMSQSTAAEQPQIVSSGSIISQGGKPTVSFDGSNDSLEGALAFSGSDLSYFLTINHITPQNTTINTLINGNTDINRIWSFSTTQTTFQSTAVGGSFSGYQDYSSYWNASLLMTLIVGNDGADYSGSFWLNQNETAISNTGYNLGSHTDFTIGSRTFNRNAWTGYMSEFVFYPSDQSTNRTAIEALINTYYNIY